MQFEFTKVSILKHLVREYSLFVFVQKGKMKITIFFVISEIFHKDLNIEYNIFQVE